MQGKQVFLIGVKRYVVIPAYVPFKGLPFGFAIGAPEVVNGEIKKATPGGTPGTSGTK